MREGGFPVLWHKLKIFSKKLVELPILLLSFLIVTPFVIIIRILKPVIWIRFGFFLTTRIGHFSFDVEYYLIERKLGLQPKKAFDLFFLSSLNTPILESFNLQSAYNHGKPANTFFAKMCSRHVRSKNWASILFFVNHWLPGGSSHELLPPMRRVKSRDMKGLFQQIEPQLYFSKEETLNGQDFLEEIGFKYGDKFVCLIVRDSGYLNTILLDKETNWEYHNFRDTDIDTYEKAALALAEKGYWVFRMGKVVREPFKADHPNILDYANSNYRSDFLDIWLMANCFFCITTGTGLDEISKIFRKPLVFVNYLPIETFMTPYCTITLLKHLVWQNTKKRLTLLEHLDNSYSRSEDYEKAEILIEDLNAEEIRHAVLELEARLSGTWIDYKEDKLLQDKFWNLFKVHKDFYNFHDRIHPKARIGTSFLKENPEWLN